MRHAIEQIRQRLRAQRAGLQDRARGARDCECRAAGRADSPALPRRTARSRRAREARGDQHDGPGSAPHRDQSARSAGTPPLSYPPREGNPESERGWRGRKSDRCRAGMRPAGNPKAVLRARCSERLRRMENRTFNAAAVGPASDRRPTIGVRQIACEGGADQLSYSVQWPARRQKGVIC